MLHQNPTVLVSVRPLAHLLEQAPMHAGWLGDAERVRFEAMTHEGRRQQFLAGHWLARELLAQHADTGLDDWTLEREASGAPRVLYRGKASDRFVTLAHSGRWVAAAVAASPIGVDIESPQRERDVMNLASSLYDAATVSALRQLEATERRSQFFTRWTLDEAHAKVSGDGLKMHALKQHVWLEADGGEVAAFTGGWADGWLALVLDRTQVAAEIALQGDMAGQTLRSWCLSHLHE